MEGQEIATAEPVQEPARVIDLMEALKASLGGARGGASGSGRDKKSASGTPASGGIVSRKPAARAAPATEKAADEKVAAGGKSEVRKRSTAAKR